MAGSFSLVFNSHSSWCTSLQPPPTEAKRSPGFLGILEQQTLGKTPAKHNFKQPWSRRAMRLEELPGSLLHFQDCVVVRQTRANATNSLFSPFQAVKTNGPVAPIFGRDPFSFASSPRLSQGRYLFKQMPATRQSAAMPGLTLFVTQQV